jgi:HEPN domain-containing protein
MEEYKRWFAKAEDDLNWALASIRAKIYYGACFASQQAAEKALKSFLLKKKKLLPKTHDLVALLENCIAIEPGFEDLRDYTKVLFFYYVETRYPDLGDFENINLAKAQEAYDSAKSVVDFTKSRL